MKTPSPQSMRSFENMGVCSPIQAFLTLYTDPAAPVSKRRLDFPLTNSTDSVVAVSPDVRKLLDVPKDKKRARAEPASTLPGSVVGYETQQSQRGRD